MPSKARSIASLTRKRHEDQRGTAHERGYDARWKEARLQFIGEHPLCVECESGGRLEAASVVDHVVPHRGDVSLFWDIANWQSLCKRCHDRKTRSGA